MTGENRRLAKSVGSPVIAGSINLDGPLLIRSKAAGDATRWAQICQSVRPALLRSSPTQRLANNIVGVFVPIILVLGAGTAIYWAQHLPFDRALLTGLAVLVVACPCAVGLAAPMATSLGIGRLARRGCLVRDPAALEALARTRVFAFDKTGTLTSGKACVVGIDSGGAATNEVLARAAGLGCYSDHWFFGLCDLGMGSPELGYVSRAEIEETAYSRRPPLIERDLYFRPAYSLSVYKEEARRAGRITENPIDLSAAKGAIR